MLELNRLYNLDCMQGMREFPDGFFDLAIVDPPYGIGIDGQRKRVCRNPKHNRKEHSREGWDSKPPTEEYFRELERVSRNQVIWGGNYFVPMLKQAHNIALSWNNLEALCQDCHNKEHHRSKRKKRYSFDENGNVILPPIRRGFREGETPRAGG